MRQLSATYVFLFKRAKPSAQSLQTADANAMTSIHVDVPGEPTGTGTGTGTGTALLETASASVQGFQPINKIHQHQCAFHFYADDMARQVEAHHFCAHQNEDMRQCLIYDGEGKNANLIGVEYMVPEQLFLTLSDEEKRLWHSHEYEVKSGMLFMPRVPGPVEREDMEQICKTYGKTFHLWQVDRGDRLPLGVASLMMAFTADGQLREDLAKDVERRYGVSFEKERGKREYMRGPDHGIHPLANGAGKGLRLELREVDLPPVSSVPRAFV